MIELNISLPGHAPVAHCIPLDGDGYAVLSPFTGDKPTTFEDRFHAWEKEQARKKAIDQVLRQVRDEINRILIENDNYSL